ncbi:hypothetical protein VPHD472_0037 [Vibrio phage D472]
MLSQLLENQHPLIKKIFTNEVDQLAMQISDYCIANLDSSTGFTLGKDSVIIGLEGVFYARRAPATCRDAQYFLSETKRIILAVKTIGHLIIRASEIFPDGWGYITGLTEQEKVTTEYVHAVQRKYSLVVINNFLRTNQLHLASLREVQTRQLLKGITPTFTIKQPCEGLADKWEFGDSASKPYKSLFNK